MIAKLSRCAISLFLDSFVTRSEEARCRREINVSDEQTLFAVGLVTSSIPSGRATA